MGENIVTVLGAGGLKGGLGNQVFGQHGNGKGEFITQSFGSSK
jgi:hypothetical protein